MTTTDVAGTAKSPRLRVELLLALAVAVGLAGLGLPLGLLWRALSPRVELVVTTQGPLPVESEPEGYFAAEGWYAILTFATGLLAAAAVWAFLRRYRGPWMLVALIAGSVAGGVLTAWLGHHLGYAQYLALIENAPVDRHIFRPPDVRSDYVGLWLGVAPRVQGAVLVQAFAAALTYTMLAAFSSEPDLRPSAEPFRGQPAQELAARDLSVPSLAAYGLNPLDAAERRAAAEAASREPTAASPEGAPQPTAVRSERSAVSSEQSAQSGPRGPQAPPAPGRAGRPPD